MRDFSFDVIGKCGRIFALERSRTVALCERTPPLELARGVPDKKPGPLL